MLAIVEVDVLFLLVLMVMEREKLIPRLQWTMKWVKALPGATHCSQPTTE